MRFLNQSNHILELYVTVETGKSIWQCRTDVIKMKRLNVEWVVRDVEKLNATVTS